MDNLFGHLASWRRQIYTSTDTDTNTLPGSFELTYDNHSHRIFITFDEFTCFKCKSKGHRADDCPTNTEINIEAEITNDSDFPTLNSIAASEGNTISNTNLNSQHTSKGPTQSKDPSTDSSSYDSPLSDNEGPEHPEENDKNISLQNKDETQGQLGESFKRPLSITSTSDISTNHQPTSKSKSRTKRKKHSDHQQENDSDSEKNTQSMEIDPLSDDTEYTPTIKEIFAPLENNMRTYAERYVLSFENLRTFVSMVTDNKQAVKIAKEFTNDLKAIHTALKENYPFLKHRKTKTKFTKIMNQLEAEFASSTNL